MTRQTSASGPSPAERARRLAHVGWVLLRVVAVDLALTTALHAATPHAWALVSVAHLAGAAVFVRWMRAYLRAGLTGDERAALVALAAGDATGREVTEWAGLGRAATYLTLHALEERGLVASVQEPRPNSDLPRRRYRLTDSGRDALGGGQ
jgi:DNA-binding transcriptional ArsR family regulator